LSRRPKTFPLSRLGIPSLMQQLQLSKVRAAIGDTVDNFKGAVASAYVETIEFEVLESLPAFRDQSEKMLTRTTSSRGKAESFQRPAMRYD
ncbi:hypothetical protein HK102_008383, partial [Quaeritorhiza haematococci]